MKNAKLILLVAAVSLSTTILFQNIEAVTFHILFWQIRASRIVLILTMMLLGGIIGFFVGRKSRNW